MYKRQVINKIIEETGVKIDISEEGNVAICGTDPVSYTHLLQLACMKLESLVIANQNVAVNTFPGLVHTARHTMGAVSYTHLTVWRKW